MPIPTPFHSRTQELCTSYRWKDWAGYYTVCSYDTSHEPEYFALRHACGAIDVTPLFKYEVRGKDAARFLSYVTVKNINKLKPGQVTYLCWCDDDGKIIDDGTVTYVAENHYRVTAAEPSLGWFGQFTRGFEVSIEDSSLTLAALSVQGPTSRGALNAICADSLDDLKFFRSMETSIGGTPVTVTRTGYTGDLGYEVWIPADKAPETYDRILEGGQAFGILPVGLDAMDVTRIEAGFIMNGVDYFSANHCLINSRKSSPYEINLGWCVQLNREPFMGQQALQKEKLSGSPWQTVGLVMDYEELEQHYLKHGLPPSLCSQAWRTSVPIYSLEGEQVGYATSGAWSPLLKKNLALATIQTPHAGLGKNLLMEATVEYVREKVTATVTAMPFFNPPRKRA